MRVARIAAAAAAALLIAAQNAPTVQAGQPEPLSLQRSIEILHESNRAIRLARRQLNASAADVRRADVGPNPSVSTAASNASPNRYRLPDTDWIIRLEQLVERGRKRDLRVAAARALARAASLDILETTRQQRLLLGAAYVDLVVAQQALTLALETLADYQRLRQAAERRLQAGDIAAVDVARLRVEEGRASNEARSAAARIEQARLTLGAILGVEPRAGGLQAADDLSVLGQPLPGANDLQQALDRRPDVAALQARIDALGQARELALSQRTRDITLGAQTERSPALGGQVFGISASIPLFVNNDFSGDILRAEADLATAREDLERLKAAVASDAARAAALTASAGERAEQLTQNSLPESLRAAQAIEFAFSRGAATLTDLFDARRQFATVRAETLTARAEYAKAVLAWREAVHHQDLPR